MSKGLKFLALLAAATLVACGDDDGGSNNNNGGGGGGGNTPNNLPDPCSLASTSELAGITAQTVASADSTVVGGTGDPVCDYLNAQGSPVFQLILYEGGAADYEGAKSVAQGGSIPGLGSDAFADLLGTVHVRTSELSFIAQSLYPVADGNVSPEIQTASAGLETDAEDYEASYRLAKVVLGNL